MQEYRIRDVVGIYRQAHLLLPSFQCHKWGTCQEVREIR